MKKTTKTIHGCSVGGHAEGVTEEDRDRVRWGRLSTALTPKGSN